MITLRNVVTANAISCIVFGLTFFLSPNEVGSFLSADDKAPDILFTILGVGLFVNGMHLTWASFRPTPGKPLILYFSVSDFIWVASTSCLILLGIWITTPLGVLVTLLVSGMVGAFGVLQLIKYNEIENSM